MYRKRHRKVTDKVTDKVTEKVTERRHLEMQFCNDAIDERAINTLGRLGLTDRLPFSKPKVNWFLQIIWTGHMLFKFLCLMLKCFDSLQVCLFYRRNGIVEPVGISDKSLCVEWLFGISELPHFRQVLQ